MIIDGVKVRNLPTFYGGIINDGDLVGVGHFKSNGYWVGKGGKHITSYIRIEDGEDNDAQFERLTTKGEDGETLNFFFIASYDGADFNAYIEGLKN